MQIITPGHPSQRDANAIRKVFAKLPPSVTLLFIFCYWEQLYWSKRG